jgi:hypothetical protein
MLQYVLVFSYYVPDRDMRLCKIKYSKQERRKRKKEDKSPSIRKIYIYIYLSLKIYDSLCLAEFFYLSQGKKGNLFKEQSRISLATKYFHAHAHLDLRV